MAVLMMVTWADHACADETEKTELRTLQAERIKTLEELLKLAQFRHAADEDSDLADVLEILAELRVAKLDTAAAPAERRKALEEVRDAWKELEALVADRVRKGTARIEDQLRVRAGQLETEVMLARLKQASGGGGKE